MARVCKQCGEQLTRAARFCPRCGTSAGTGMFKGTLLVLAIVIVLMVAMFVIASLRVAVAVPGL